MMKFIFNPFIRIAGLQALSFGTLFLIAGSLLAGLCNARFDGALDLHFGNEANFIQPLIDQLLVWSTLVLVFYPMALVLGAKPRLVDIAGTFVLARTPYMFAPLLNAGGFFSGLSTNLKNIDPEHFIMPLAGWELIVFILFTLLALLFCVWLVILYFNAWKTSTNLKGNRLVMGFIGGIVISEILSIYLTRHLFV